MAPPTPWRTALLRAALAVGVAGVALTGIPDPAAATTVDVLVVGDSLTADATGEIRAAMASVGYPDVAVAAFGGTDIAWAVQQLRAHPDPPIVVLASGTNNTPGGWSPADRADAAAAVQALRSHRCATWVLPAAHRHPDGRTTPDAEAAATVDGIRAALAGTAVSAVDWSAVAATRPEWHQADGVHHTARGRQAYAELLASGTRAACGPRPEASTVVDPDRARRDAAYVDVLHRTFLDRPATADESARWTLRLAGGAPRSELTRSLASSPEWVGVEIDALYRKALGRESDPGGRAHWHEVVLSGRRIADIGAELYGSPEFRRRAGGTDRAFVRALYAEILGRDADAAGLAHWESVLRRGVSHRDVAAGFYASVESRRDRVEALYQRILRRSPDPGGHAHWAEVLQTEDDVRLAELLAASQELYERSR